MFGQVTIKTYGVEDMFAHFIPNVKVYLHFMCLRFQFGSRTSTQFYLLLFFFSPQKLHGTKDHRTKKGGNHLMKRGTEIELREVELLGDGIGALDGGRIGAAVAGEGSERRRGQVPEIGVDVPAVLLLLERRRRGLPYDEELVFVGGVLDHRRDPVRGHVRGGVLVRETVDLARVNGTR